MPNTNVCCTNPYPDYDASVRNPYLDRGQFNGEIKCSIAITINKLEPSICENMELYNEQSDYTIYTGYGGIAYYHLMKYKKTKDPEAFKNAKYLIKLAITNLSGRRISFLNGDAGPLALGIVMRIWNGEKKKAEDLIEKLLKLNDLIPHCPDEILYGRAGYVYAFIFIIKHVGRVIPVETVRKQLHQLLKDGHENAKSWHSDCPLMYEWHEKKYFGAAHGIAGILYVLLVNKDLLTDHELYKLIRPTLDWLIAQKFPSGNFPSSLTNKRDRLVQWCHGAPGYVHLLVVASEVYRDSNYMELALECGDAVWNRGLLSKGYSICHGVAGNAYTFAHLHRKTKDLKHLHRLACFVDWCTKYPINEGMPPDRPLSLFEGRSGLLYLLMDCLIDLEKARFPGFEL